MTNSVLANYRVRWTQTTRMTICPISGVMRDVFASKIKGICRALAVQDKIGLTSGLYSWDHICFLRKLFASKGRLASWGRKPTEMLANNEMI